jgi:hypothetical protein
MVACAAMVGVALIGVLRIHGISDLAVLLISDFASSPGRCWPPSGAL